MKVKSSWFLTKLLFFLGGVLVALPSLAYNPIFHYDGIKDLAKDELLFVVEIPQGSTYKFELRTASGSVINDRRLCPRKVLGKNKYIYSYPAHYGVTVGRFNEDHDPLDLVVFGENDKYWRQISFNSLSPEVVRIIGMIKMEECGKLPCTKESDWEQDWKVVAVDKNDFLYRDMKSPDELPSIDVENLTDFFGNYKGEEKGYSKSRVAGFLNKEETIKLINSKFPIGSESKRLAEVKDCEKLYEVLAKNPEKANLGLDEKYLSCVSRVQNKELFPGAKQFTFFLQYTAVQHLLELGEKDVNMHNAISRMEERKEAKKKYYRFVGRDTESPPGTGAKIYEWVKTVQRNDGCPKDFPMQHYEKMPLITL